MCKSFYLCHIQVYVSLYAFICVCAYLYIVYLCVWGVTVCLGVCILQLAICVYNLCIATYDTYHR